MRLALIALVLAVFSLFSGYLVFQQGYFGFVYLAMREAWALQMLIDVGIACSLFLIWMVGDARARRLPIVPYVLITLALGSIGPLSYLLHRELASRARAS